MMKILKKKKLWLGLLVAILLVGWASGFLSGWYLSKAHLSNLDSPEKYKKLLVIAPHPDDEILIAGGFIQKVLKAGGEVRVVYLTSGDGSKMSVVRLDKRVRLAPTEFLNLAETRREEAISATGVLGLAEKDLVFMGFPDESLLEVLGRFRNDEKGPVVSKTTKVNYVPYSWAFKPGQKYLSEELESDLVSIIKEFNPSAVITTNIRDNHPDHKAAFEVVDKIRTDLQASWQIFTTVVHFKDYPEKGAYLYPPKKIVNDRWRSISLTDSERQQKKEALEKYKSQVFRGEEWWYISFVAKNEIFERD
jgi:N-acetyl-1-D-myo-inositol-2-amino-2-deoxy-alpha-D-glucopyranoside deacetylase